MYTVTTLADSGAGSLRYGIQSANGPRTIVFHVSGTIYLNHRLTIERKKSLTIAGQTAPGEGITLAGQPILIREADNIILRHLRIRVGDINASDRPAGEHFGSTFEFREGRGLKNLKGDAADALSLLNASNILIDHISTSWGIDETISVGRSYNVTVQNCIIAAPLIDSYHHNGLDGKHGYGSLIVGGPPRPDMGGVTYTQNIYAHCNRRNASVASYYPAIDTSGIIQLDFSNNVIYNWVAQAFHVASNEGQQINLVGNLYIPGPSTDPLSPNTWKAVRGLPIYERANWLELNGDRFDLFSHQQLAHPAPPTEPYSHSNPAAADTDQNYLWLLDHGGAYRHRDRVDLQIIDDIRTRGGQAIDSQDEVGGFPDIAETTGPIDADNDGMPDAWETANSLNPHDPSDRNLPGANGRTKLDDYLNSLMNYAWSPISLLTQAD